MAERSNDLGNAADFESLHDDMEAFRLKSETQEIDRTEVLPAPLPTPVEPEDETVLGLLVGGFVSIAAGMLAFAVVAGIVAAIIVPPWYRSLEPRYQAVWCNRISLLCDLQPEHPDDDIYRLTGDESQADEAVALLATETETPAPTQWPSATPTQAPATPVPNVVASTATLEPPTMTPSPTITPSPSPTPIPLPQMATLQLEDLRWEEQKWNNCGPTTITMGLSYFGYPDDQFRAAGFLKPEPEDKNVSPDQMVAFVNNQGELPVRAIYRVGGTRDILMKLIANDFPVIIERGIVVENDGWAGHYGLVVGYDEISDEYLFYDSYLGYARGAGRRFKREQIEQSWQEFNYTFIVLYNTSRENDLMTLLGDYADPISAATVALGIARLEATQNPDNKWAWFNMGTSFTMLGNYDDAVIAYDRARTLEWPFRMMWYQFGPYIAYYQVGRYDDVLALALAVEHTTPYVEETYYYRGLVYAAQGKADSAIFQFDRALNFNENFSAAAEARQAVLQGRPVTVS